ncbi:MAG: sigma-54-dependent transcriptional regulator [Bradymonadia bacterium]
MPAPDQLPVLIVDDQPAVVTAVQVLLEIHGLSTLTAEGPDQALEIVRGQGPIGLVIQDMNFTEDTTSGEEGIRLFRAMREIDADLPVLLFTAWGSVETAVQMVKEGASDYLTKPWDDERLVERVQGLLQMRARHLAVAQGSGLAARQALGERFDLCGLIYESGAMHDVVSLAVRVAAADVPVLITGPNGVGKEKIAEIIQANSGRRKKPFVRVNAGALPETLIESELFGHEAGAYTGANKKRTGRFEAADHGTLFLDEIGNLPLSGQTKLLRVLQTGAFERVGSSVTRTVDVRLISATNADLPRSIADGTFRQDLYFRLNVIEIKVPPLVYRTEDIEPLARHFLRQHFASGVGGPGDTPPTLGEDARRALLDHDWPGNVRELTNCMQRALLLHQGGVIRAGDLGLETGRIPENNPARWRPSGRLAPAPPPSAGASSSDDPERAQIEAALQEAGGIVARAAAALGLSRQALYRRMERHGIVIERRTRGS